MSTSAHPTATDAATPAVDSAPSSGVQAVSTPSAATPSPDAATVPPVEAKVDAKPAPLGDDWQAQIESLKAALADSNQRGAEAQAAALRLEAESLATRRESALVAAGLPHEYHDVAPQGDPRDPAVASALEAWVAAHPMLVAGRGPVANASPVEAIAARAAAVQKEHPGRGIFFSPAHAARNWQEMNDG